MFNIRNIKASVKIKEISLSQIVDSLKLNDIKFSQFSNFISFQHEFTFIIFKPGSNHLNHINITKIFSLNSVPQAIQHIKKIFKRKIKNVKIDNIIATVDLHKQISLRDICIKNIFEAIKYNNETFPGLFVKFSEGTAIIFHTGKVVVVGCKTIDSVKCITQKIFASI